MPRLDLTPLCPASMCALNAVLHRRHYKHCVNAANVGENDRVLVFNTGTGLKYR